VDPRSVHVGLVAGELAVGQFSLCILQFYPVSNTLSMHNFYISYMYNDATYFCNGQSRYVKPPSLSYGSNVLVCYITKPRIAEVIERRR